MTAPFPGASGSHAAGGPDLVTPGTQVADGADPSLGELFGRLAQDVSTLVRQEAALAKAELRQEAVKAGKGAGLFGGTALAALFGLLMLSFAAAWALAAAIPAGWAFLLVALIYLGAAAALFMAGRKELRRVRALPQTVETLQEDARWAKHPTS